MWSCDECGHFTCDHHGAVVIGWWRDSMRWRSLVVDGSGACRGCGFPVCRDVDSLSDTSCGSSARWDVDSRWVAAGLGHLAMDEAAAWSTEVELGDLYGVLDLW